MIPQKLTFQGLYSYRETQVIDFNHLVSAGLFGIFGAVGSGKSSILEAITFVLYQETERMNATKRLYNMMNLQSNTLSIEFEFTAGKANQLYKFVFKAKRNSKQFDVVTSEKAAYLWTGEVWSPTDQSRRIGNRTELQKFQANHHYSPKQFPRISGIG